jgi:ribosomal protein S12 methylthiotransferase accessory factor
MRVWYSRIATPTVQHASLPQAIQQRLRALAAIGVNVVVKDFSQELAPVICVFAQSPTQHFTRVAAACCFDPVEAVEQALAELETGVGLHGVRSKLRQIRPEDVVTPQDHGDLYTQRRYFRRADFLAAGGASVGLSQVGARVPRDWTALTGKLTAQGTPIWHFDLSFPGAALHQGCQPLAIVRAMIPGLLPIHFGYRTEPLVTVRTALAAQRTLRVHTGSHFPHPFP